MRPAQTRGEGELHLNTYRTLSIDYIPIITMSSSDDDDQSVSSGDDQPVTKKQKTYATDGPIEDDKTAREKLEAAGFDPDDVHTARSDLESLGHDVWNNITPMAHFASLGDLPMFRYLYHVREATTTAAPDEHWTVQVMEDDIFSPMYAAVSSNFSEVAKWLFRNGAREDTFVYNDSNELTPLSLCFRRLQPDSPHDKEMAELAQWFILNGVLEFMPGHRDLLQTLACCAATVHASVLSMRIDNDNPIVTITHAKNALDEAMPILLSLSEDLLMQTDAFYTFLLGAIPAPEYSIDELKELLMKKLGSEESASIVVKEVEANGKGQALWDQLQSDIGRPESSNSCLAAHPGILERIGAYVGFVKSKTKLKRLRSFHDVVSNLTISNLPEHCFEYS